MPVRAAPPGSGVGTADDQVVPGRLDLDVVLAATDDHGLPEDVLPNDRAVALDRLDRRPDRGQHLLELRPVVLPLALEVLVLAREVARVGLLDDALEGTGGRTRAGQGDDRAERGTALRLHQHPVVTYEDERTRIEVVDPAARPEADADREASGLYRALFHGGACVALAPRSIARSESSMVSTASMRLAFFSSATIVA